MTAPQTSRRPDAAWNPQTAGSAGTNAAPLVSHDAGTRRPSTAGDTSGAATRRCDYAACAKPATEFDPDHPEWGFCLQHYLEHRADLHDERWPPMRVTSFLPRSGNQPCGTQAAERRHRRNDAWPCTACLSARAREKAYAESRGPKRWAS